MTFYERETAAYALDRVPYPFPLSKGVLACVK